MRPSVVEQSLPSQATDGPVRGVRAGRGGWGAGRVAGAFWPRVVPSSAGTGPPAAARPRLRESCAPPGTVPNAFVSRRACKDGGPSRIARIRRSAHHPLWTSTPCRWCDSNSLGTRRCNAMRAAARNMLGDHDPSELMAEDDGRTGDAQYASLEGLGDARQRPRRPQLTCAPSTRTRRCVCRLELRCPRRRRRECPERHPHRTWLPCP
jgi:hypothetical protein